jgi:hypothetical protein
MQRHVTPIALAALLICATGSADAQVRLSDVVEVLGTVTNSSRPVDSALVIALNLSDFYSTQTFTTSHGAFKLPPLKAGVYRIIAAKHGFAPAIATVFPGRKTHSLTLRLEQEKNLTRQQRDDIWAIRSSLPKDVLRELDSVLGPARPEIASPQQRFQAEMMSVAGLATDGSAPSLAETAVGVRGRVGGGWTLDFKGKIHKLEDLGEGTAETVSLSESSGMVMELKSEPGHQYRIATSRSSWRPELMEQSVAGDADLEAHNFEWRRPGAKVQVRYLAQENLFNPLTDSELFEVSGDKTLLDSRRNRLGVSVAIGQESLLETSNAVPFRTANVAANGEFSAARSFIVHYGVQSRFAEDGMEWSPQTAAEWRFGKNAAIIVAGSYKLYDERGLLDSMPAVVFWSDPSNVAPRYRYALTFVRGDEKSSQFSATATVAEVDGLMRLIFDDGIDQLMDGLYLETGDVRRDVSVSYRRNIGRWFAVDVSTMAGTASGEDDASEKVYLIGDLQSLFRPTRTSIDISYRHIEQPPIGKIAVDLTRERMNVTMGQALPLPIDVRLLLGLEMARLSAPIDDQEPAESFERRYVGGLSFAF